jgi:hypothetical protein
VKNGLDEWENVNNHFPIILRRFVNVAAKVLLTESAVERSFQALAQVWSSYRSRMGCTTMNDWLFVRWNWRKVVGLQPKKQRTDTRTEDLCQADWEALLGSLACGARPSLRGAQKRSRATDIGQLRVGLMIEIGYIIEGQLLWFRGIIMTKLSSDRRNNVKYSVSLYEQHGQPASTTDFLPATEDTDWRIPEI